MTTVQRLPNLLLIGAMKSGTSSLYADLMRHPAIFFPAHKEPNGYAAIKAGDAAGTQAFCALYAGRAERYLGDASTGYTKFPVRPDVAAIVAAQNLPDLRILYMTRDPIRRAERHLAHHIGNGETDPVFCDVTRNPEYAALSAYDMQLSLWRGAVNADCILHLTLEDYQRDRAGTLARVFGFLDLAAPDLTGPAPNRNRAATRRSAYRSPLRHVLHSRAYNALREHLPDRLRRRMADLMLPRAKAAEVNFTPAERAFLTRAITALNTLDMPDAETVQATFAAVPRDPVDTPS